MLVKEGGEQRAVAIQREKTMYPPRMGVVFLLILWEEENLMKFEELFSQENNEA